MKAGGQHETPAVRREEELEMAMGDMDVFRVFALRRAEADRKLYRSNVEKQILMEMERAEAKRWEMVWGTTCDIAAAGAGGCFAAAVMRQDMLLFLAAVAIFAASRIARRAGR